MGVRRAAEGVSRDPGDAAPGPRGGLAGGRGHPPDALQTARLLTSELVTNSVGFGPPAASIGLFIDVDRERIRIEVADVADAAPRRKPATEDGGYGLTIVDALASRWDTGREGGQNLTWFELDLPAPGLS